jgi:ABC-2 type transport system ATP-binding protein
VLRIEGLSKTFGRVAAVSGVDLVVRPGTVVGLVGPNGSGKTTTLSAVVGLAAPDGGTVTVCGFRAGTAAARRRAAFVPDEPRGLEELTVDEYLQLVRALYGAGGRYATRAHTLTDAFGIAGRTHQPLRTLSHGLRRQVAAIAAVAVATPLLVVDEATSALDPEAVLVLEEAIAAAAAAGGAVLIATQDLAFAERACDEICVLARGRVVAGAPRALRRLFAHRCVCPGSRPGAVAGGGAPCPQR